jgi:purine-binding chemotaxis protein CheW
MANSSQARTAAETGRTLQIVCFTIGEQTYGIGIESVREIRAWSATTTLPNTPGFVRGVVNLRGSIVPILDLRARFNQGQTEPTKAHVVIVVQVGPRLVGMLVDTVSDIVKVAGDEVREVPDVGGAEARECLDGLIAVDDQMIALVSAARIVAPVAVH